MNIHEIARAAGISVRTLHHYDAIGLLRPNDRLDNGYRSYAREDAERLQQILFYRELGFSLAAIRSMLSAPDFDRAAALRAQAEEMERLAGRYRRLAKLARETLTHLEGGIAMSEKDMLAGFDYESMMEHQKKHEGEAEQRWGNTEAYRQSASRAKRYRKEDWERIGARQEENLRDLIACYRGGEPHDGPRAAAVCAKAQSIISENFYDCTDEIFSGLGEMYVADERFTAYYDKHEPGLAAYYSRAIQSYCAHKAKE